MALGRDRHADPVRHLGQLLDGRSGLSKPAIYERLDERTGREFRFIWPPLVLHRGSDGRGGGGEQGLHGLSVSGV